MKLEMQRELGRRTLALLDGKTTDMAPATMEEPLDGYVSVEQYEQERNVLFNRTPMFVGLSCDLPRPGSWMTFDATGTPMLLTRDEDGRVRAFLNMCQHRGVRVVESGCGEARRFTCPFHAWVYDTGGRLVGVPGAEGFSDMRREDRGLIELPAEEKYGLLFASANPDAPFTIDDYLGPELAEQFASFGFETWQSIAAVHPHHIATNWKVVWGTHCETYHFASLHKLTARPLVYGNTSIADFYGDHALMTSTMRTIDQLREKPEADWAPVDDGQVSLNYRLFPGLSFSVVFGSRLEIFTVFPGPSVHETVALHYAYRREAPATEAEATELEEQVRWACQTVVDGEDYAMAARAGEGLRAPFRPKTLVFGRNEPVMQHMALTLRRRLGLSV
jgi:phenylpropionate dioxygenase-like ring-hydroxylating dioxygenase large terminal subunit